MMLLRKRKSHQRSMTGFTSSPSSRATFSELWFARHLTGQLVWRDITVRYRHTWLGCLWALLSPAMNLALYYVVFGIMIRMDSPDYHAPYALVLLSGLVLWMLFSAAVNAVGDSLLNNLHLVKKIYFPRIVLTVAATGVSVVDFLFALLLLCSMALFCHLWMVPLYLPALLLLGVLTALLGWGLGCIIAIVKLRFRDARHVVPLFMQALFYATPVVWTTGLLPPHLNHLFSLNPLVGLTGLFRFIIVGGPFPGFSALAGSAVGCILIPGIGYYCFTRYESQVLDRE